jgi:t-SNARE complex subunit (syntaxin)
MAETEPKEIHIGNTAIEPPFERFTLYYHRNGEDHDLIEEVQRLQEQVKELEKQYKELEEISNHQQDWIYKLWEKSPLKSIHDFFANPYD